ESGVDTPLVWSADSPTSLMTNETVTKGSDGVWTTASSTPWPAEDTHAQFFAFSPAESATYVKSDTPALHFTTNADVAQQVDLLYAESAEVTTAASGTHKKVALDFTHALTKFRFSAKVQPNQKLYISSISLHNLSSEGNFAYATGAVGGASWSDDKTKNREFSIGLRDNAKEGIISTTGVDVTADNGAVLAIPQTRKALDASYPETNLFSGNSEDGYIKVVYSLQSTTDEKWIVGTGSEVENQVTAYIPQAIAFEINKALNFRIDFGVGNGGYDNDGEPIIAEEGMVDVNVSFTDWDLEESIDIVFPPLPEKPKMMFTIMTNVENQTFTLPFVHSGTTGTYTLIVDWGDGNVSVIKPGESLTGGIKHTYAVIDDYRIAITSSELSLNKAQIPQMNAYQNGMLKSIDTPLLKTGLTDFSRVFERCSNMKTIPADLFKNNKQVVNFSRVFADCHSLQNIPAGLFHDNRVANNFNSAFMNCYKAKVDPNIFCDESTEKGKRFNSLTEEVDFRSAFSQVGRDLSEEEIKVNIFPALWSYSYSDEEGVASAECFDNAKMGNYLDVPANGSWGTPFKAELAP
ncbi:MAG: fimbrillin family protein, partial [Phocaeicola sp.]